MSKKSLADKMTVCLLVCDNMAYVNPEMFLNINYTVF